MSRSGNYAVTISSLPLQIFVYCSGCYLPFFFVAEALMFVYKGAVLPYSNATLAAEIILLVLYAGVEGCRLFIGAKGNLTQRKLPLFVALALAVPVLFGYLFFLLWQTYVLRIETVLIYIGIVLLACQVVFSFLTVWAFLR
ncbi:transmembrane protein 216-like isoform X2 [Oscarella lobularis]